MPLPPGVPLPSIIPVSYTHLDVYKRQGEEFCKLIKRHCEENEIERPEDLRVRTVANKSKMKAVSYTHLVGIDEGNHVVFSGDILYQFVDDERCFRVQTGVGFVAKEAASPTRPR